ncbi:hypothetical protein ColLi_09179 [Colletotrichum liriopes]|uniref:Uncharacterized protein n=1 Tax=Colletotrichum liriopes TaxID=708192 RepID=A0AA37GSB7_9PEZI|nr:hypothetical protein ColLi_09179 [Colletotrichum liriopes]
MSEVPDPNQTPPPGPAAPAPTTKLEASDIPADWATRTMKEKVQWLNTQPLPSDPTVSLGSCYDRGTRFNVYAFGVWKLVAAVKAEVDAKGDQGGKLREYANLMMSTFKQGLGFYSNAVAADCMELLDNGKYGDKAQPLTPMTIPGISAIEAEMANAPTGPSKIPVGSSAEQTSIWAAIHNVITIMTKSDALNQPRMNLGGTSWATLFHAFLDAGKKFWEEWKKTSSNSGFTSIEVSGPGSSFKEVGSESVLEPCFISLL